MGKGRYVKELALNKPADFVEFIMNDYLQKNQFSMSDWKGEPVFRAGDAVMEGYKYLKWSYANGTLHLEAWLKSSTGKEWDLDGFTASMQKKPYKSSLEQLFQVLQQDVPQGQGTEPVVVQTVDYTAAATQALICGIVSVAGSFIMPLAGFLFAVIGYSRSRMGMRSSKAGTAKAGRILSTVGVVLSILMWILNIIMALML